GFALVVLGLSLYEGDSTASDVIFADLVAKGVKAGDIDTIEMEKPDGSKLKLVRTDAVAGTWVIDAPIKVKADSGQITRIVEELFRAKPVTYGDLTSSKATHGLDPPGLKVTLRKGNEQSATVNIGDVTGGGRSSVAFITTDARPDRPIAIPREAVDPLLRDMKSNDNAKNLAKWVNDYRTRQVFSVNPQMAGEEVTALTLAGKGDNLALNKSAEGWKMTASYKVKTKQGDKEVSEPRKLENVDADPQGDSTAGPNSFNGVISLIRAVTSLQAISADDFLPDDPAKLVEYGLADDNPDRIKVELKVKGATGQPDRSEVAFIGKKGPLPATPGQTTPPGTAPNQVYVRVPGMPGVIKATGSGTDGIIGVLADPSPMRNRNLLPSDIDRNRVAAIDLVSKDPNKITKLRQPPGSFQKWALFGEPGDPTDANSAAVNKVLDVIFQPRTAKDFPAPNDANFVGAEYQAEIRLWTEMQTPSTPADPKTPPDPKAEPQPKGSPVVLTFGKVTTDASGKREIYVRRTLPSGAKADFILPAEIKTAAAPPPHPGLPQTPPLAT